MRASARTAGQSDPPPGTDSVFLPERLEVLSGAPPELTFDRRMTGPFQRAITSPAAFAMGGEAGGLLLGRMLPGNKRALLIEGYHAVAWDRARGGAPHLTLLQERLLAQTFQTYRNHPSIKVVGIYRTCRSGDLAMGPQDLDLFREYFQDPLSVYALLRPVSFDTTAGAVYWLGREDPSLATAVEVVVGPGSSYSLGYRAPAKRTREWVRRTGQVMAVAGALLVPVTWLAWDAAVESRDKAIAAAQERTQEVRLSILRAGGDLLISWTRPDSSASPLESGRLTIVDSDFRKEFVLDRQQLRSGRLVYQPVTADVNVTLHATTADNQQVSDTLRAFYPSVGQQPPASLDSMLRAERRPEAPTRESVIEIETRTPRQAVPAEVRDAGDEESETPKLAVSRRRMQLPPRRRAELRPVAVPDPPDIATDLSGSIRNPVAIVPKEREILPAWHQQPAPATSLALQQPKLTPAVATSTPHPVFLGRARDALKEPYVVAVRVAVGANGRVTSASAVQQAPASLAPLAKAAEMAAKRWRFRPATVDGRPIPAEVTISFRFVP
jgi:TonB family protein